MHLTIVHDGQVVYEGDFGFEIIKVGKKPTLTGWHEELQKRPEVIEKFSRDWLRDLRRFHATIDGANQRMHLAKSASHLAADTDDTSGLHLLWVENQIVVGFVDKHSPADQAEIAVGDVLLDLNGSKTTGSNMFQLRNALRGNPGKDIQVTRRNAVIWVVSCFNGLGPGDSGPSLRRFSFLDLCRLTRPVNLHRCFTPKQIQGMPFVQSVDFTDGRSRTYFSRLVLRRKIATCVCVQRGATKRP